ncbi:hypothetical protein KUCAC02_020035, partial [Chaenocephalus aceratus]
MPAPALARLTYTRRRVSDRPTPFSPAAADWRAGERRDSQAATTSCCSSDSTGSTEICTEPQWEGGG